MNLSLNVLENLKLIQINFDIENKKWIGKIGLDLIPPNMDLNKFGKFFTKCFNKEPGYSYTYEIVGGLIQPMLEKELNEKYKNRYIPIQKLAELNKIKSQPIKSDPYTLSMELNAEMEFFSLTHKLTFKEFVHDEVFGIDFLQNAIQSIEAKLDKTITLVNLKNFKLIDLKSDTELFSCLPKHKVEFELSEQIDSGKSKRLIGFSASSAKLDLSAYPYEFVRWDKLDEFYNLEELIINGQTSYKAWSCGSNEITDTIAWPDTVIDIETINSSIKCLTINNIYRVENKLGCLDWAPELQELILIGCKGGIDILGSVKSCDKLKKIKLINCVPSINLEPDLGSEFLSTFPGSTSIYRLDSGLKNASYDLRSDIPCSTSIVSPFLNSSYALAKNQNEESVHSKYTDYVKEREYNYYQIDSNSKSTNNFAELKKWCDEKKIELIVSDYVDDKKVEKKNFPYFSKVQGNKQVDISIDYEQAVQSLMTQMDPCGSASYPSIFNNPFDINEVNGSNSETLYAQF